MITADHLARELGCTLADLEELTGNTRCIDDYTTFSDGLAALLRLRWSRHTGIDYTENAK